MRRLSEGMRCLLEGGVLRRKYGTSKFCKLLPWNQNFSVTIKVFGKLVTMATEKIQVTPFFYSLLNVNLVHRSSVCY